MLDEMFVDRNGLHMALEPHHPIPVSRIKVYYMTLDLSCHLVKMAAGGRHAWVRLTPATTWSAAKTITTC